MAHIRNAFAHGRVSFYGKHDETYIALEDVKKGDCVSARMILSKSTLVKWKNTIESGPDIAYEERKKAKEEREINELGNGSCRAYQNQ